MSCSVKHTREGDGRWWDKDLVYRFTQLTERPARQASSELNRQSETCVGNKPSMADIRESGAVEQETDMIFLLYVDANIPPSWTPSSRRTATASRGS